MLLPLQMVKVEIAELVVELVLFSSSFPWTGPEVDINLAHTCIVFSRIRVTQDTCTRTGGSQGQACLPRQHQRSTGSQK